MVVDEGIFAVYLLLAAEDDQLMVVDLTAVFYETGDESGGYKLFPPVDFEVENPKLVGDILAVGASENEHLVFVDHCTVSEPVYSV